MNDESVNLKDLEFVIGNNCRKDLGHHISIDLKSCTKGLTVSQAYKLIQRIKKGLKTEEKERAT